MVSKEEAQKIIEWLNYLAVGTTDVVTKEQEKEILDLSCKLFSYAYSD